MCNVKAFTGENFYRFLCGVLLAIVGFVGTQIYIKNVDIQKDLIEIKITLAKLQSESLTKEDVKEIAIYEITKHLENKK